MHWSLSTPYGTSLNRPGSFQSSPATQAWQTWQDLAPSREQKLRTGRQLALAQPGFHGTGTHIHTHGSLPVYGIWVHTFTGALRHGTEHLLSSIAVSLPPATWHWQPAVARPHVTQAVHRPPGDLIFGMNSLCGQLQNRTPAQGST